MANKVFANGMEIACKAGAGKVIAAFPDVCMTPPECPATPMGVPCPYPNTAMASDTTGGSKKVKISNKEVMLKNKSCFKTSTGDEAGAAAKKGLISSKNKGKVYFVKWSMDVKVEGKNVDRHLDMTTNNHGSPMANDAVPWVFVDAQTLPPLTPEQEIKCAIQKCDEQTYDISITRKKKAMPKRSRCSALGSKKHKCVDDKLKGKKSKGIYPEETYKAGSVPGLARNRRPDVVVFPNGGSPPSQPCNVYDAIFPCSDKVKDKNTPTASLSGIMPSAPIFGSMTAKAKPTSKESICYQTIAGKGKVTPLSPEDCKNEKCP